MAQACLTQFLPPLLCVFCIVLGFWVKNSGIVVAGAAVALFPYSPCGCCKAKVIAISAAYSI